MKKILICFSLAICLFLGSQSSSYAAEISSPENTIIYPQSVIVLS